MGKNGIKIKFKNSHKNRIKELSKKLLRVVVTIFFTDAHLQSKHYWFLLKYALHKERILISVNLKSYSLSANLLHIIHEEIRIMHKALPLHTKV